MEEIFEVWTWRLGFHSKPVGFLNAENFWQPLIDTLHGIASAGFLSTAALDDVVVEDNLPDVLKGLSQKVGA